MTLRGLTEVAALADIDRGMAADDKAAYGAWSGEPRVPFFRFPGFGDTPALLDAMKARHVAVFGADLWASDWIPMTPDAELALMMGRLRAAGRGIILLHDIKKQTTDMLPRFLLALKTEGFHVVHIVPSGGATPTRPAPEGWSSETEKTLGPHVAEGRSRGHAQGAYRTRCPRRGSRCRPAERQRRIGHTSGEAEGARPDGRNDRVDRELA